MFHMMASVLLISLTACTGNTSLTLGSSLPKSLSTMTDARTEVSVSAPRSSVLQTDGQFSSRTAKNSLSSSSSSAKDTPMSTAPRDRGVTLKCAQGATGLEVPAESDKSGVTLESLTKPMASFGQGTQFGLAGALTTIPFRKVPIYLISRVEAVTLSVPTDGQQFLAWVPYSVWTTSTPPPKLQPWIASKVTLQSCDVETVGFLGGMFARDPARCFPLTMAVHGSAPITRSIRLDGKRC